MSRRRLVLSLLITAAANTVAPVAHACCLSDWMYGRQPAYAAVPVGPPVSVGTPVTVGYAPYTAGYAPVVTAGMAPVGLGLPLAPSGIFAPAPSYAVQRPAYGAVPIDNPSVYTGLPVNLADRGLATTSNPFYGTGNIYPDNYASNYRGASPAPVVSYRPELSTVPLGTVGGAPVVMTQPTFATPVRSGLARFFNSLLGTGYRSAYYPAEVTYYRPAVTVDPVLGSPVTVQQPCVSTVEQLQRTPYATYDPAGGSVPYYPPPVAPGVCETNGYGSQPSPMVAPAYAQSYEQAQPYGQPQTYSQVAPIGSGYATSGSGVAPTGDQQPLSAPTLPSTSVSPQPSTSYSLPLTGMSPTLGSTVPGSFPSYNAAPSVNSPTYSTPAPSTAPSLESARPPMQMESRVQQAPPSYYAPPTLEKETDDREPASPSESSYERSRYEIQRDRDDLRNLTTQSDLLREQVRPIPAPEAYRNPFQSVPAVAPSQTVAIPKSSPPASSGRGDFQAPDLLPPLPAPSRAYSSVDQAAGRRSSQRMSVPVREASIQGESDRLPSRVDNAPVASPAPAPNWQPVTRPTPPVAPPPTKTVWYSLKK